jgi:hypothetical protein
MELIELVTGARADFSGSSGKVVAGTGGRAPLCAAARYR